MISDLTIYKRALLMARLSRLAYNDNHSFKDFGYDSVFLSKNGSQAYFLWDRNDAIIVCRGTDPNELSDIVADLRFALVPSSSGIGLVHRGFKASVDNLWEDIEKLLVKYGKSRKLWCTGHSLGAAMATLISARCHRFERMPNPVLFTFGSPRVGNDAYVEQMNQLNIEHHRWVNNADIVTRNPVFPYHHHGELNYFDHDGNKAVLTQWQMVKDRVKGFVVGIKHRNVNFFVNHSINNYITNLERL